MCHMSQCEGQRTTSRSQLCSSTVEEGSGDQIQVIRLKLVSLLSDLSPKVKCSNLPHPCNRTYEKLKHGNKTAKKNRTGTECRKHSELLSFVSHLLRGPPSPPRPLRSFISHVPVWPVDPGEETGPTHTLSTSAGWLIFCNSRKYHWAITINGVPEKGALWRPSAYSRDTGQYVHH